VPVIACTSLPGTLEAHPTLESFHGQGGEMPRSTAPTSQAATTPPASESSPAFDFSLHMRRVCADMCARLTELAHIDLHRVAVAVRRARKRVPHGLQASLTPLRFAGGQLVTENARGRWTIQRLYETPGGREYLYILNFYLPRFLNQPLEEKLVTIIHELWHVGPA